MTNIETNGLQIVKRISQICDEKKIVRKSVSEALKLPDNCFSNWSARGTIPAGDICLKIAQYLDVSVEWLITGKETGYTNEERKFLSLFGRLEPSQQKTILAVIEQMAAENAALEKNKQNA